MKKRVLVLFSFWILLIMASFSVSAAVLNVCSSCNYTSIQTAINSAAAGDTINVFAGIYNENQIIINKSLTILGAGASTTIIDGGDVLLSETGLVRITAAGNVLFSGFTIRNAGGPAKTDGGDDKLNVGIYTESSSSTAVYTITNNKITGTNNADDAEDYGFYSNSGKEKIVFQNNEITKTGANAILLEKHEGETDFSYNSLDEGVYGSTAYFSMTYNGEDITKMQRVNHNIITLNTGSYSASDWTSGGITFNSAAHYGTGDGKYTDIEIINNTIKNLQSYRRGISLVNDASGSGAAGKISAVIKDNKITGIAGASDSRGIQLYGLIENFLATGNIVTNLNTGVLLMKGVYGNHYPEDGNINYNDIYGNTIGLNSSASFVNGENNWWGDCSGPGGIASGNGDKIYGIIDYTPWLGACPKGKAIIPICVLATDSITLYANVSGSCIGQVIFSVNKNGTWQNYTGMATSGIGNYAASVSGLVGGTTVQWTVYADDCYRHVSKDGNENFYVNRITSLTINPISPDGLNNWYVTEPIFSLINPDANKTWYRWDGTGTHQYTSPFNLTDIPNLPSETAGILKLTYWSTTSCGIEQEQSKTVYIDLKDPILKNYIPADKAIIVNRNQEISVVIDEVYGSNSGINKNSVGMKLDNVSVARVIADMSSMKVKVTYGALNLSNGEHIVEVFGQDNSGRQFYGSWSFTVNSSVSLNLNVFFPQNLNYSSKQVLFNLSTNNLASMQYYENGKLKTLCTKCNSFARKLSFGDGLHNLTIKASDSYGNSEEKRVSFIVDSTKPRIISTKPARNEIVNGSEFFIKYTEENLKSIKLVFKTSANITKTCEGGRNKNCTFSANLSAYNGNFLDYYFEVSDGINIVNSKETRVKVDTVSPVINSINKTIKKSSVKLKVNITEENFDVLEYYDNNDGRARWKPLCSSLKNGICEKEISFKGSSPSILLRAIDDAGNSVQTRTLFSI